MRWKTFIFLYYKFTADNVPNFIRIGWVFVEDMTENIFLCFSVNSVVATVIITPQLLTLHFSVFNEMSVGFNSI